MLNVDTGSESVWIHVPTGVAIIDAPDLTEEGLELILNNLGQEPPVPESLLADAMFLAYWRQSPDPRYAILLAAIACEIKAKTTLLEQVAPEGRRFLEMVLDNPRAFPQTALELYDKVTEAVLQRSLRMDDRELFKKIQKLFEVRNRIAHGGATPTETEAKELVSAARQAFAWLKGL